MSWHCHRVPKYEKNLQYSPSTLFSIVKLLLNWTRYALGAYHHTHDDALYNVHLCMSCLLQLPALEYGGSVSYCTMEYRGADTTERQKMKFECCSSHLICKGIKLFTIIHYFRKSDFFNNTKFSIVKICLQNISHCLYWHLTHYVSPIGSLFKCGEARKILGPWPTITTSWFHPSVQWSL